MYDTEIPCVGVVKGVQREGIKLWAHFWWIVIFSRASGNFKIGGGGCLSRGGSPGIFTGACFPHPDFPHADAVNVLFLGLPRSVMVQWRYAFFMKFVNYGEFWWGGE